MDKQRRIMLMFFSAVIVVFLIILDQATKIKIVDSYEVGEGVALIEGVLEFVYVKNTGAAFSFLRGAQMLFIIITPIICGLIVFFYTRIPFSKRFIPMRIFFICIIAGAIGNWIDRLTLGFVRDFIYFSVINFPVFNVADIYVTVSVILFLIFAFFFYKNEELSSIFLFKKSDKNG